MMSATIGAQRLRSSRDVSDVLRRGDRRSGRLVAIHATERDDEGPPRLAFVASRRVGPAVSRNRSKRLLREAAARIVWAPGTDVVIVARSAAATSSMDEVRTDLQAAAEKLGVVHDH